MVSELLQLMGRLDVSGMWGGSWGVVCVLALLHSFTQVSGCSMHACLCAAVLFLSDACSAVSTQSMLVCYCGAVQW
jgi:hypothetical protein